MTVTINAETEVKVLEMRDNNIYIELRLYNKDIISHNLKHLLYKEPISTLHSKTLPNEDFHRVSNLDLEIINIDILSTLTTS